MSNYRFHVALFFFVLVLHALIYPLAKVYHLTWFGNFAQALALLFAALQFGQAARRSERADTHALNFLAFAFWVCLAAHLMLGYSELLLHKPATGTATDAIWLTGYALIARSLILLATRNLKVPAAIRLHAALLLPAAAIVTIVLWKPLTDPERSLLFKFIQVIFPFLDFWIAFLAFALFKRSGSKGWLLGAGGSFLIGVADLIFPYFPETISTVYRFLDIPLYIGYSLWWLTGAYFATRVTRAE